MLDDPIRSQTLFERPPRDESVNGDGSINVTERKGVEIVMDDAGSPKLAGVKAIGIENLADVLSMETRRHGPLTLHIIRFVNGGVAQAVYFEGKLTQYNLKQTSMLFHAEQTKGYVGRRARLD